MKGLNRWFFLALSIVLLAACNSASGKSEYSDEYFLPIWLHDVANNERRRLVLIRTTDGSMVEFNSRLKSENDTLTLRWSPDYEQIAYVEKRTYWSGIYITDNGGNNAYRLERQCSSESPQWSPNSNVIVFVSSDKTDICNPSDEIKHFAPFLRVRGQLYTIDAKTRVTRQITDFSDVAACDPDWSPDGQKVVFQIGCAVPGMGGASSLYVINSDGTGAAALLDPYDIPPYEVALAGSMRPKWSPDGEYVAFEVELIVAKEPAITIQSQLLVTSEDGTKVSAPFPEIQPWYWEWSPADNRLAILDKTNGLVIGDPFSGEVESMDRPDVRMIAWAPDGKSLAFEENGEIYVVDLATKNISNLTANLEAKATLATSQWIKIPVAFLDSRK